MLPAIAEVKSEHELLARRDSRCDLDHRVVLDGLIALERIGIDEPDPPAIGELELVQVRQIPTREPLVNRPRNVCDGPTMKIRPGDGLNRAPSPPRRSTRT